MNQTTLEELEMTIYNQDSTATAVVLYEHANLYLDPKNNFNTRTDYYYRIKILDKNAFDLANITLNLFGKKRVKDIKAITYNLNKKGTILKNQLSQTAIFTIKEKKEWTVQKFTLPNIKQGSVIEYSYSILSPYLSINDWYFQSDIPKIKSEYDLALLGNYQYNIRIIGFLKLDKDVFSVKKKCVKIPGIGQGTCAVYSYGMGNIPAFKEEDYMLSKKNYLSRISFDLKSYTGFRGDVNNYATTWEKADKSLKKYFFNKQTSKKNFFKNKLSKAILATENNLDKAKKVYTFVQNHYTWNEENWTNEDVKVKQAFNAKSGSIGEINLSLYNCLKAADIDANLVVLSTRKNGISTKLYPIIFDYNYVIIKINIDKKDYYLDASSKYLPFGQLPIRTLNGEARVIRPKLESSWVVLKPKFKSFRSTSVKLSLNPEGEFTGTLKVARNGYFAATKREAISLKNEESYLEDFENQHVNIEVDDYSLTYEKDLEKPLKEAYKIKISLDEGLGNKKRINPFFFDRLKENPFKLNERKYPVDFGYSKKMNYYLNLEIPEGYKISQLPKDIAIGLPNKNGSFFLNAVKENNTIKINVRMTIKNKSFSADEYFALKEFYKQIIIAESSYIIIEKK
jgi:hypothetical protein